MSSELKLDNSKELFKLNKDVLSFKLSPEYLSEQEPVKSTITVDNEISVKNLTDDYIAFRIKTTKKYYYCVKPIYCIIPPKEFQIIKITFLLNQGEIPKLHGHKFKFEAFIIPENEKDKDPKDMFREYSEKGESLVGNSQKTFVQFINENEIENSDIKKTNSGNLLTLPNIRHKKSGSDISEYHEADEEKKENENENDKKEILMDQIQSNEDKKTTLFDIISGEKIESNNNEENKDEKIEEKNDEKIEEKKDEKIEEKNDEKIEEKNDEKIEEKKDENNANSINTINSKDNINKNEIINKDENANKGNLINEKSNIYSEEKNKNIKNTRFHRNKENVSDYLIFIALFIAMIIGYYLVK